MAQQGIKSEMENLCCSICLDLMRDPVTIPCGHSYCRSCINNFWDEEEQKGIYSCPQCRQTFSPRPVLVRNTVLADLVEEKQKPGVQTAPDVQNSSDPGHGHVDCDFCTEKKLKAVKSCLQCLVSYCEQHLQPHFESPAFIKHKLVDPSGKLQESICSHHNELMKIFCRTDQSCICYLCSMDEHKDHQTVSAAAEMMLKQKELGAGQEKVQQRIQQKVKDVKMLQSHIEVINQSADEAVRVLEKIFTDAKQQIRSRQKVEVTGVNELQEKLEQEIGDLRKRKADLEQLSQTEDHIQFLLRYSSLSRLRQETDLTGVRIHPLSFRDDATATVSAFKDKLHNVLSEERITITESPGEAAAEDLRPQKEPETREEFLQYACPLTLDPYTAHVHLNVYNGSAVRYSDNQYERCLHPDRFTSWPQVLCREHLTGRCYWEVKREVQLSSYSDAFIAVAYKDILRDGAESAFGNNNKSWMLQCFNQGYEFRHNSIRTPVSGPQSSKVGVFLDPGAGVLSFYSVSDSTMTLLHRVQTTFTRPVCPGLALYNGDFAEFCKIFLTNERNKSLVV